MKLFTAIVAVLLFATVFMPGITSSQDSDLIFLRVALQDDIKSLNPIIAGDDWSNNVLQWIYDYPILVDYDSKKIIPYIAIGTANLTGKAESWNDCDIGNFGYSPRSTWADADKQEAIVFYDFENVTWHDGTQMTIRDMLFSFHLSAQVPEWSGSLNCLDCLKDGGTYSGNYSATRWLHIFTIWEDGNKAALKFVLQNPYSYFFRNTISPMLLPYHIWGYTVSGQSVNGAKIWCDQGYNVTSMDSWQVAPAQSYENDPPIGSGLFKYDYWEIGRWCKINTYREHFYDFGYLYKSYTEANFPNRTVKQPTIDGIFFAIYYTTETALLAIINNHIDYISWSVPPLYTYSILQCPNITYYPVVDNDFFYMGYNMRRQSFGYNESESAPYESGDDLGKPLRRAISHCLDKNKIVQRLLLNLGMPGNGPFNPLSPYYNSSVPKYPFDPDAAKQILADAGYKVNNSGTLLSGDAALAAAGQDKWWVNPNGSKIGSSADGVIEILTPEPNYDPIRAQAGLIIAQQLRDIGINAESIAMDFGSIVDRIDQRNFDMYILGWKISSESSDFFYSFYHSSNAETGQNYLGYQNESFDALVDRARETGDEEERKALIFQAQAALCYDLPMDVLYFRKMLLPVRTDRFFGWVQQDNGIFNSDSIVNLHGPYLYNLHAKFNNPPSTVLSNSTTTLTIAITGEGGLPMEGAQFTLNASIGKLDTEAGTTDSMGQFSMNFTAPYVPPTAENILNGSMAFIQITSATCDDPDYSPSPPRFIPVIVYPEGAKFISVNIRADPDIINPDKAADGTAGFTYVTVGATDQDGIQVAGSSVTLSAVSGTNTVNLTIEPDIVVTDANGKARFTVTAGDLPNNDSSVAEYVLKATAIHPDDANITGENSIVLIVIDANRTALLEDAEDIGMAGWVLPSVVIVLALIAVFLILNRRKKA